ncbi:hypothetical protein BDF19DRAFT_432164 [Syncephalis fuscata]|nr:hypothetical protein BDF19DRAFT_432164 [Syncephalis fuscata]
MEEEYEPIDLPEDDEDGRREVSEDEYYQMIKDQILNAQLSDFGLSNPYPTPTHVAQRVDIQRTNRSTRRESMNRAYADQYRSIQRTPSPTLHRSNSSQVNPFETPRQIRPAILSPPPAPHSNRSSHYSAHRSMPPTTPESPTPNRRRINHRSYETPNLLPQESRSSHLNAQLRAAASTSTNRTVYHPMGRQTPVVEIPPFSASHRSRTPSLYRRLDASDVCNLAMGSPIATSTFNNFHKESIWAETLQYTRLTQYTFRDEEWSAKLNKPLNIVFEDSMAALDKIVDTMDDDDWIFDHVDTDY